MFFFSRKKKKKQPEQAPKWFIWLMGGFVTYAILTNLLTDKVAEVQRQAGSEQEEKAAKAETEYFNYAAVSGAVIGGAGSVDKRTLFAADIEAGQGKPVDCWNRATLDYRLYDRNGKLLDDSEKEGKSQSFTVGKGEVTLAMERGVMGMKVGGKRAVSAHPSQLFDKTGFYHHTLGEGNFGGYILTLKEVIRPENLPLSDLGLRLYDDKVGDGQLAQCTDKVRIKLHGWLAGSGEVLWKDLNLPGIKLRLGEGIAPYAIERGVMGMQVGGKRTLIVPPGYMKPLFAAQEPLKEPEAPVVPSGTEEQEATIEQTPTEKMAAELERRLDDNFAWESLPVPSDQVIILEIELLPEKLNLPDGFVAE